MPEGDLLSFRVGTPCLQSGLLLLYQVNQGNDEGDLAVDGMARREEFVKLKWWRKAEEGLKHVEDIFHKVVVAVRGQLEALLGNVLGNRAGVKQDDEIDRWQVHTGITRKNSAKKIKYE